MTLKLRAAAEFVGLHEQTLLERAKAGKIPGAAKPGKCWVFQEAGLVAYLNQHSPCPYTASEMSGTSTTRVAEVALDEVLKLPTRRKPRSSTTHLKSNSGNRISSEKSPHFPGVKG